MKAGADPPAVAPKTGSSRLRRLLPWFLLFGTVTAIDVATRFALPFDLHRVLAVETGLFLAGAGACLPVARANLVILGLGLLAVLVTVRHRRRRAPDAPSP